MIVEALGGLCNRLRVILSRMPKPGEPPLVVYWAPDTEVAGGRWDECFEPLPCLEVVYERPAYVDIATSDNAPVVGWKPRLLSLTPVPAVAARIDELRDSMGGRYDAMFMRRTDGTIVAHIEGNFTPDEAFRQWAQLAPGPLFLATDNGETQRKVRGWVGERLVVEGELGGQEVQTDRTRHQALPGSVVNLYVYVHADRVLGSGGSSFSHTIDVLRACYLAKKQGVPLWID